MPPQSGMNRATSHHDNARFAGLCKLIGHLQRATERACSLNSAANQQELRQMIALLEAEKTPQLSLFLMRGMPKTNSCQWGSQVGSLAGASHVRADCPSRTVSSLRPAERLISCLFSSYRCFSLPDRSIQSHSVRAPSRYLLQPGIFLNSVTNVLMRCSTRTGHLMGHCRLRKTNVLWHDRQS